MAQKETGPVPPGQRDYLPGCRELETLLGPVTGLIDTDKVLEIGKKLSGISQQIIADREDRV